MDLFVSSRFLGVIAIFLLNKLADFLDRIAGSNAQLPNIATNYFVIAGKTKQ